MERQSRTWLCSVVFLDIVKYTEKAVTQQIDMKEHLQEFVAGAVSNIAESERIIVDTGDGAALCFLGDPEEALFVALNLRDLLTSKEKQGSTPFEVRIGINLGPVKVVKSLSGQLNPLGDGINNAQRVMSFAKPGQILVSRSFYEVIACLSQEYAKLFHFLGTRKDKHVKEHAVYEVKLPEKEQTYAAVKEITERIAEEREENLIALTWDPAVLKAAEKDLAQYIGPLAKVLVSRAAQQVSNAEELYSSLATMIPEQEVKDKFLAHMPGSNKGKVPAAKGSGQRPVTPPASGTAAGQAATTASSWDPAVLKDVEQGLAIYLGPLAKVLVNKAAKKTSNLEKLYRLLADELTTAEEQDAFLKAVRTTKKSAGKS